MPNQKCDIAATLYNYTEAMNAGSPCYIAGIVNATLVLDGGYDFTVGDGTQTGAYTNSPLDPGKEYLIRTAAVFSVKVSTSKQAG